MPASEFAQLSGSSPLVGMTQPSKSPKAVTATSEAAKVSHDYDYGESQQHARRYCNVRTVGLITIFLWSRLGRRNSSSESRTTNLILTKDFDLFQSQGKAIIRLEDSKASYPITSRIFEQISLETASEGRYRLRIQGPCRDQDVIGVSSTCRHDTELWLETDSGEQLIPTAFLGILLATVTA